MLDFFFILTSRGIYCAISNQLTITIINLQIADNTENFSELRFLMLNALRIRKLGDIGKCHHLTILLLANNYIVRINALAACQKLVKLDLHGNQVSHSAII